MVFQITMSSLNTNKTTKEDTDVTNISNSLASTHIENSPHTAPSTEPSVPPDQKPTHNSVDSTDTNQSDSESDSEYKPTILIMNGKGDLYEFEHKFVWDLWEEINKGADFSLMQLIIKDTSGIKNPEIKYEYDIIREVALRSSKDIYHC